MGSFQEEPEFKMGTEAAQSACLEEERAVAVGGELGENR